MKFVIYDWWGNGSYTAPYEHNSIIEGDILAIAQDFYNKGLNVMIRHKNDYFEYDVLYISQKGFTTG